MIPKSTTTLTAKGAIARMISSTGYSYAEIGRRLGHNPRYVTTLLNGKYGVSVATLDSVADVCGYRIMLVNDDTGDAIAVYDGESS